jgi:hypothetical protein
MLGGPSRGVRYASPFALAVGQNPRLDALCPSAAPAPRQAERPSRRPIRRRPRAKEYIYKQERLIERLADEAKNTDDGFALLNILNRDLRLFERHQLLLGPARPL